MYFIHHTYMPRKLPIPSTQKNIILNPMGFCICLPELLKLFLSVAPLVKTHKKSSVQKDKSKALPKSRKRSKKKPRKKQDSGRIYSSLITLWGMVLQRLLGGASQEQIVSLFMEGNADALRPGKKPSKRIKSGKNVSFCKARQRLPLELIRNVFAALVQVVFKKISNSDWKGWNVLFFDGSTLRMHPQGNIGEKFKPHRGKHQSHWSLMRVVVGFCVRTGLAVCSSCGSTSLSEPAMVASLIFATKLKTLFIGDSAYGIFSIVQAARHVHGGALVAMTQSRAKKLAGIKLMPGMDLDVVWEHSQKDKLHKDCSDAPIKGRLIVVTVHPPERRSVTLYLFTTLTDRELYSVKEIVALYGLRWHVELNLRNLKDSMKLGFLTCKSAEMAEKEWFAGLIAYNIVRSIMLAAAHKTLIDPLELSFASSKRHVERILTKLGAGESINVSKELSKVASCRLPRRKKDRPSEPRLKRHVRETFGPLRGSRAAARQKLNQSAPKC